MNQEIKEIIAGWSARSESWGFSAMITEESDPELSLRSQARSEIYHDCAEELKTLLNKFEEDA